MRFILVRKLVDARQTFLIYSIDNMDKSFITSDNENKWNPIHFMKGINITSTVICRSMSVDIWGVWLVCLHRQAENETTPE